jgi:hypothetical protein
MEAPNRVSCLVSVAFKNPNFNLIVLYSAMFVGRRPTSDRCPNSSFDLLIQLVCSNTNTRTNSHLSWAFARVDEGSRPAPWASLFFRIGDEKKRCRPSMGLFAYLLFLFWLFESNWFFVSSARLFGSAGSASPVLLPRSDL